jgi:hypothetical protein
MHMQCVYIHKKHVHISKKKKNIVYLHKRERVGRRDCVLLSVLNTAELQLILLVDLSLLSREIVKVRVDLGESRLASACLLLVLDGIDHLHSLLHVIEVVVDVALGGLGVSLDLRLLKVGVYVFVYMYP